MDVLRARPDLVEVAKTHHGYFFGTNRVEDIALDLFDIYCQCSNGGPWVLTDYDYTVDFVLHRLEKIAARPVAPHMRRKKPR